MIVLDASFVYALLDDRDAGHGRATEWYREAEETVATTPLAMAEVDLVASRRGSARGLSRFRQDLAGGAYGVRWWPELLPEAVRVAETYSDSAVSLTDASLVVLAGALETSRIATFDERHFRAMRPLSHHNAFELVPADA